MAEEVTLKLRLEGGQQVSSGIDKVNAQLASMAQKAQGASGSFKPLDPAAASMSKLGNAAETASKSIKKIGDENDLKKVGDEAKKSAAEIEKAFRSLGIKSITAESEKLKAALETIKSSGAFDVDKQQAVEAFRKKMAELNGEVNDVEKSAGSMGSAFSSLSKIAGSLFAGFSISQFAGKLVSVQREFDVLNSALITITGSSAKAENELQWIKSFAAETPYSLTEVTNSFIKLKTLGLDASQPSLTSFGNTASAMGKSLDQMIEAVADASTGEFERLKEFGIKANKNGDEISLTFQGVTTTVKNSAEEIIKYLTDIGNNNFAGAMEERAKTLDGAISNLGDSWDELFRTINNNNTGVLIFDSVKLATGAISDMISLLNAMNSASSDAARETGVLASAQNGLKTVFETVAILGMNVKFVLVQLGQEMGAFAAHTQALLSLNFSAANQIRQMRKEDAAQARGELDRAEQRVLSRNKYNNDLGALSEGLPTDKPKSSGIGGGSTGKKSGSSRSVVVKESDEAKAYEQALKAIASAKLSAEKSTLSLTAAESALFDLQKSPVWASMPETWKQTAIEQSKAAAEYERTAMFMKAVEAQEQSNVKQRQGMIEQIQAAEKANEMYGLTASQISVVEQSRLADAIAILEQEAAIQLLNGASEEEKRVTDERIKFLKEELSLRGKLSDVLISGDAKKYDIQDATDQIKESTKELDEFTKQAAHNMQDAMAEFFIDPTAKGMQSIADGFGKAVQKMIAQAAAAQLGKLLFGDLDKNGQMGGWIGKLFGSFSGGGSASAQGYDYGAFDNLISGFANGGIMTSAGPLKLNSYASGGIANTPQLSMFGEGRTPEAYVPLPDGKRIPVHMQGGSNSPNITVHVNSQTGDPAEIRRSAASGARTALGIMSGARRYG